MSDDETQQFDWYLVRETDKARCFSEESDGSDAFWVPKSLIRDFLKYPPKNPDDLPLCMVEVPEWWAEDNGLI